MVWIYRPLRAKASTGSLGGISLQFHSTPSDGHGVIDCEGSSHVEETEHPRTTAPGTHRQGPPRRAHAASAGADARAGQARADRRPSRTLAASDAGSRAAVAGERDAARRGNRL